MANTALGAAVHASVGGALAAPADGNRKVLLAALVAKGVLTAGGAYAAGKGRADLEKALGVPDPVEEVLAAAAHVAYGA